MPTKSTSERSRIRKRNPNREQQVDQSHSSTTVQRFYYCVFNELSINLLVIVYTNVYCVVHDNHNGNIQSRWTQTGIISEDTAQRL